MWVGGLLVYHYLKERITIFLCRYFPLCPCMSKNSEESQQTFPQESRGLSMSLLIYVCKRREVKELKSMIISRLHTALKYSSVKLKPPYVTINRP
jgi:hypothetical protein